MKINSFAIIGFLSLVNGSVARHGNRFRANSGDEPLAEKSRVTAFVNTENGVKIECWEIGTLLPDSQVTRADGSKGTVRRWDMTGNPAVTLLSYSPDTTIFSTDRNQGHSSSMDDFDEEPNLVTVTNGILVIETIPIEVNGVRAQDDDDHLYIFSAENGDNWFYFEDTRSSSSTKCAKTTADSSIVAKTFSGSQTTLIDFRYPSTPPHTILHEGRCNFAGLKPVDSSSLRDSDYEKSRFRSQE